MKAKQVSENINFKRNQEPISSMGIGNPALRMVDWFTSHAKDHNFNLWSLDEDEIIMMLETETGRSQPTIHGVKYFACFRSTYKNRNKDFILVVQHKKTGEYYFELAKRFSSDHINIKDGKDAIIKLISQLYL